MIYCVCIIVKITDGKSENKNVIKTKICKNNFAIVINH